MEYIKIPEEVSSKEMSNKNFSFSAGMYRSVNIPNKDKKQLKELLHEDIPFHKGIEPGTINYVEKSPYKMIRTKALKNYSNLITTKGDSVISIKPQVFNNPQLKDGDILISKDSNIGECCLIYGDGSDNHTYNSGIVKLNLKEDIDRYYLYAFLKHPLFRKELEFLTARGSTIKHAGKAFLDCYIPFPQKNKEMIIKYISTLMQKIIEKEYELQIKSKKILKMFDEELKSNQAEEVEYEYPTSKELFEVGRLDTSLYIPKYKELIGLIKNYTNGYATFSELGFNVIPGPSLEIKILKTRIDSESYVKGYYNLILPTNISEHGILNKIQYLGTPKKLPELRVGDVIVGEAGFGKGRSFVLLEDMGKCTTNAHGIIIRRDDTDIQKSILARSVIYWYRENGLFDLLGVGGSGGHLSPEYFDTILIPKFDELFIRKLNALYYNNVEPIKLELIFDKNLESIESDRNKKMGIINLKREIDELKEILINVQDAVILDLEVPLPSTLKVV